MDLENIQKKVEETLSEKRYYHSKCVMERCGDLAKKFGYDVETAKKVGMAHDIAKELTDEEKLEYCKKNNIEVDDIERKNISLLHAKIGADMVKKYFNFDNTMCNAIKAHTTGIPKMDMLAKILFISDRTSLDRKLPDIDYINELLNKNIDEAVLYILDNKIELQIKKHAQIHINTILARNEMLNKE